MTFWKVNILGVDTLGVDIPGVDILGADILGVDILGRTPLESYFLLYSQNSKRL